MTAGGEEALVSAARPALRGLQIPAGRFLSDRMSRTLCAFEARLVVEVDGSQHAQSAHDAERDAWLANQDFLIKRFWNDDVLSRLDSVLDTIAAEVVKRRRRTLHSRTKPACATRWQDNAP